MKGLTGCGLQDIGGTLFVYQHSDKEGLECFALGGHSISLFVRVTEDVWTQSRFET